MQNVQKIIFVFGNEDVPIDSLPLRIVPALRLAFPECRFEIKDPNEEWDVPEELIIIDNVVGLEAPRTFDDLRHFSAGPMVSLHDFDAYANLRLLQKLGKLKRLKIIGLPPGMAEDTATEAAEKALRAVT